MTTPGQFRMPIRTADIWGLNDPEGSEQRPDEDIAADLDYQDNAVENFLTDATSPENVPTFGESMDRGREAVTQTGTGSYSSSATFESTYAASPRVVLTVECGRAQDLTAILTSVSTSGFAYRVIAPAASTTTALLHWVAVDAG
jgi:hypothetical protein